MKWESGVAKSENAVRQGGQKNRGNGRASERDQRIKSSAEIEKCEEEVQEDECDESSEANLINRSENCLSATERE